MIASLFRISLLSFCFVVSVGQLLSQELKVEHFDVENGLPSSQVFSVFQDNEGYMWFTTDKGLSRYDGYSFKNFSTKDGIIDNTVLSGEVTANNKILFHTLSSGFFWYKNGVFKNIKSRQYEELLSKNVRINQQYILDKNETIWFTTNNFGKYYSLDSSGKLLSFSLSNITERNKKNGTFVIELDNKLLLVNKFRNDSSHQIKPKNEISKNVKFIPSRLFKHVLETDDSLILLTQKFDSSLNLIFVRTKQQKIVSKALPVGDKKKYFTYALIDDEEDFWVGTESGVHIFKNSNLNTKSQQVLEGFYITYIFQDNEKNIWVATKDDGVFLIKGKNIKNYLGNNKFVALTHYSNYLWGATATGKVVKIDSTNFFSEVLNLNSKNVISTFSVSKKGIFIQNKIYSFNRKRLKINKTLNAKKILNLGDSLWFVANHRGITSVDKTQTSTSQNFTLRTNALLFEPPQKLLLGTIKGLFLYNIASETVEDIRNGRALLSERIMDIKKWRNSYLLATKGRGLVVFNNDTLFTVTTAEGVKSNLMSCIAIENNNTIWVGGNTGISKVTFLPNNYSVASIYNYTNIEGLASNEVMDIAFYNSKIWVATAKGLSCFTPGKESIYDITPKLKINNILINNKTTKITNSFSLLPSENNILINYLGISFKTLGKIKYRYRLAGYNNKWTETQSRSANFTNIPAGEYVFEVQAQNKDEVWGDSKKVTFNVAQHFTQKGWFIFLIIFVLVSVPSGVVYIIFKNKKEKEKQKRKALEAELFALRNQVSPHFIFNALNSIQAYNIKSRDKEAIHYLSKFSDLMRQILENTKHSFISLDDEVECITNYLDIENLRTNNRFNFTISIGENINGLSTFIPPMLIQPHLENAIWKGFSKEVLNPNININFSIISTNLIVKITDNGIGINKGSRLKVKQAKSKAHEATGIKNIVNRIEHIKQLYAIDIALDISDFSEKEKNGKGTEICYTISLLTQKPNIIN